MHSVLTTALMIAGCSTAPVLEGKVVDIWGQPIEGATVMVVGQRERPMTDGEGRYRIARVVGRYEIKAGRNGYIQDHTEFEVTAAGDQLAPTFELYPKPDDAGFYAVTTGQYRELVHQPVRSVGTSLKSFRGIESFGELRVETTRPQIVFHTDLRHDEIIRLGLELHRLDYVRKAELKSPLAATEVSVNLYVDGGRIPIDLQPMKSSTDYMITTTEPVEPGIYAFQTQDLLSAGGAADRFQQIPEELRVVFPFEVR